MLRIKLTTVCFIIMIASLIQFCSSMECPSVFQNLGIEVTGALS